MFQCLHLNTFSPHMEKINPSISFHLFAKTGKMRIRNFLEFWWLPKRGVGSHRCVTAELKEGVIVGEALFWSA